jgi:predicted metal-dependent peptidase
MEPHVLALNRAKIQLMSRPNTTFFTTVCFSLRHLWDTTIPTACTDGKELRISPEYFMTLDAEEQVSLLLHETMHVAYLHMVRGEKYNHGRFNEAADHAINLSLQESGFRIHPDWLADPIYKGLGTEEIYNLLPVTEGDSGYTDLGEPGEPLEDLEEGLKEIIIRAALQSKMAGDSPSSIPGEIELFLAKLLKPQLPWNRILQRYMQGMAKTSYSMTRPNRRYLPDVYLPGIYSKKLTNLAIAVDISGSVTQEDFTAFISEVGAILRFMKPDKLSLIQFDTVIQSENTLRSMNDLMNVVFTGRGGTNINCVYKWADENKPQLMLVFTDGYFRFKDNKTKSNLVWLIHNNPKFFAPQGRVIHYENHKS